MNKKFFLDRLLSVLKNRSMDYDRYTNCSENGCDFICRCSTISNARFDDEDNVRIFSINDLEFIYDHKWGKKLGKYKIEERDVNEQYTSLVFLLTKILKKNYVKNDIVVSDGYYGQEAEVVIKNEGHITNIINNFLDKETDIERVLYLLELEYYYVLPKLKECKNVSFEKVPLKLIKFTEETMMRTSKKISEQYEFMFDKDNLMEPYPLVICDSSYKLIDGYHRMSVCLTKMKPEDKLTVIKLF